ncbi:phage tail protein [Microbacterium sp. SSM24]|uniref:phage tail protein n=1 Tax=Microbacterium sp. SSM24 TaxID=2991714 RepID=UPI0022269D9F|nr:phage tail protein [Microbacterium sp. SSM24]MCW3494219.1 phage tail protein [Microbacterium sp. SSM24]
MSSHFLLAARPGWRPASTLTHDVSVDGALTLDPLPGPSVFDLPLQRVIDLPDCQRGVIDTAGRRVLVVAGTGQVRLVFTPPGGPSTWSPVGLVCFPPDRLAVLDASGVVHLFDCGGEWQGTVPDLEAPVDPDADPRYPVQGALVTTALDAGLPGCCWHRIELRGSVPSSTRIEVATLTTEEDLTETEIALLDDRWVAAATFGDPGLAAWDTLVFSPPGRYLWLRLTLVGDGSSTPEVTDAAVHPFRHTSIERLPAVFSSGESDFLDRFLALTDSVRDSVTQLLDELPLQLDPRAAGASERRDFLAWLGRWVGMDDLAGLPEARRRRLIRAAAELYRRRGTPDGVARHIGMWLGRRVEVLEHYRLRRWAIANGARLGDDSVLFGPEIVRRLRLDEFSQIGEFSLVSTPSPRLDPFAVFAHAFTVCVHAASCDDTATLGDAAARIARAVSPAHTAPEVAVVRATATVGVQARLGIDALVAGPPPAGRVGQEIGMAVAADPRAGGLNSIGIDARLGSRAVVG